MRGYLTLERKPPSGGPPIWLKHQKPDSARSGNRALRISSHRMVCIKAGNSWARAFRHSRRLAAAVALVIYLWDASPFGRYPRIKMAHFLRHFGIGVTLARRGARLVRI